MPANSSPPSSDRVQRHTSESQLNSIENETRRNVARHARTSAELRQRLRELETEWDVERTLEANASTLALAGAVLGTTVNRKWFWLTGGVLGFLFQHATSGWCPPLPVLRKLGIRTQTEIDQEKFALKAVRGDLADRRQAKADVDGTLAAVSESEVDPGERDPDRVRRYTSESQQERIDTAMADRVRLYALQPVKVISERIEELQREWSIERYLQINAAGVGLATAGLAIGRNRKWGWATCAALAFFLVHAVDGFDPPLPLMRRAGRRSRAEINREIYALKILRGDFDRAVGARSKSARIDAALEAVGIG